MGPSQVIPRAPRYRFKNKALRITSAWMLLPTLILTGFCVSCAFLFSIFESSVSI
jgi:hypothetical protein